MPRRVVTDASLAVAFARSGRSVSAASILLGLTTGCVSKRLARLRAERAANGQPVDDLQTFNRGKRRK